MFGLIPDAFKNNNLRPAWHGDGSSTGADQLTLRVRFSVFNMREISLTNSPLKALVDDSDFEMLNQTNWQFDTSEGASRCVNVKGQPILTLLMHRVIMNAPKGFDVDHRDRQRLNNQKYNLRIATRSQNKANVLKPNVHNPTSRFKGVYLDRSRSMWMARITINLRMYFLGRFAIEEDAARAYNRAALENFGEFALLNEV